VANGHAVLDEELSRRKSRCPLYKQRKLNRPPISSSAHATPDYTSYALTKASRGLEHNF
jgi:hypothetical protein